MSDRLGYCDLTLTRGDFSLGVNLDLPKHGVLGLYGPSGSGKTTLLRCLAGLESGVRGEIEVAGEVWLGADGRCLPAHRRRLGYVFQEGRLFPHQTVRQALEYGQLRNRRRGDPEPVDWDTAVRLLGLEDLLSRRPDQLSGGEQQRAAIGRALLSGPRLLLMDEPLASLDDRHKEEILPFLDRLHGQVQIPIVYVSHSVQEIQHLCDRLIVLEGGAKSYEGSLVDALTSSEAPFVAKEDAAVLLLGHAEAYAPDYALSTVLLGGGGQRLEVAAALGRGEPAVLRVRATDVSLCLDRPGPSTILNLLEGRVEGCVSETEFHATLRIDVDGQKLLSRISRKSYAEMDLSVGARVYAQMKAVSVHQLGPRVEID